MSRSRRRNKTLRRIRRPRPAPRSGRRFATLLWAVGGFAVLVAPPVFFLFLCPATDPTPSRSPAPAVHATDGHIRLMLPSATDGHARFYSYRSASGKPVRFFVVRGPGGAYRAALDACLACGDAGNGYFQRGDDMVCRSCRRSIPTASIGAGRSNCEPIAVPHRLGGERLLIQAAGLEAAQGLPGSLG